MKNDVVLFGGTFDPVHNGHLIIAQAVAEARKFERITFVPTAVPPHKLSRPTEAKHRLAMLQLATAGESLFEICDCELTRPGPSYTIDTLAEMRRRHGKDAILHLIIGEDMLADLPNWRRASDVLAQAEILTAARAPWHQRLDEIFRCLEQTFGADMAASLRNGVINTPLVDISSTDIRERLAKGFPVNEWIPPRVAAYIAQHGLYVNPGA